MYDYGGRRVQRTQGGGTPANYLYDLDGRVNSEIDLAQGSFDNSNHKLGWVASYIYLGGSLLAEYANSTTYFVHKDHLGSTRLLTDMTGCVVDSLDYLPYGELYSYTPSCSAPDIALKFTGKERDPELAPTLQPLDGLDNFGARYNSSQYGRFMSTGSEWTILPATASDHTANLDAVRREQLDQPLPTRRGWTVHISTIAGTAHPKLRYQFEQWRRCTSEWGAYWVSGTLTKLSAQRYGSHNSGYKRGRTEWKYRKHDLQQSSLGRARTMVSQVTDWWRGPVRECHEPLGNIEERQQLETLQRVQHCWDGLKVGAGPAGRTG